MMLNNALRIVAIGLVATCNAVAGEIDVELNQTKQPVRVHNSGPAVVPTVYIVGRPDRSMSPVRKTKGVTLNGVRLTNTLLSESVLILRPDGTGSWGYHAGFDIFREPDFRDGQRIEPRTLVEYEKWKYDPLEPVTRVGSDMNQLRLHYNRPYTPALYEVAFPSPISIRSFLVRSNCDGLVRPGVVITVRLYADRERSEVIAEQKVGPQQDLKRFPVEFDALKRRRVFLELSAEAPQGTPVDLYHMLLEAQLETGELVLPRLETGDNRLVFSDDDDSSHRSRVVLRWTERPPADRLWDDFEEDLRWRGCTSMDGSRQNGLAFTGERFARATFPANGRDFELYRPLPAVDWTGYNRVSIATRAVRKAPMRAILLGIRNHDTHYQYVRPSPGNRWNFQTFDISSFRRDKVVGTNFHLMAIPGFDRPDDPCIYDIDSLCLWYEEPRPKSPRQLPEKIANHVSPLEATEPPDRTIPPLQEWFPMGLYDAITSRSDKECEWLFDEMKRLHMNALYVSNGGPKGLERILPLAEKRGVRLIYQGGGEGAMYYEHLATKEARLRSLEKVILPQARAWLPKFRDQWALAAWGLTEEIRPELSRELSPYYRLARELMPNNPPTVLHNNLSAAVVDLETNRPLVVTHDCYPFFWSPRSGPSNPRRSLQYYRRNVSSYYQACRRHGASLWMMPQAWGKAESAPLDPPNYGYRIGMRTPEAGEIKLQGWVAIAEGATGIMFFASVPVSPTQHHLWDHGWTETPNTRAAGELFRQATRVAPLLCRLERDYQEDGFVTVSNRRVLAHSFIRRKAYPGRGRYVVVASLDGFDAQTVDLSITGADRVYDMVNRTEITDRLKQIRLEAGEGRVLLCGSAEDFEQDCRLIDVELDKWK